MAPEHGETPTEVVGAAIVDDLGRPRRLLAARRTEPASLAGGWEFPGGKVDHGEGHQEALHRELLEELGVQVHLGQLIVGPLAGGRWPLGDRYVISVWWAQLADGVPVPLEDHDELRWLTKGELYAVRWLPADLPIVRVVEGGLAD
jgi:8-oxo-dGTP diphosphatase